NSYISGFVKDQKKRIKKSAFYDNNSCNRRSTFKYLASTRLANRPACMVLTVYFICWRNLLKTVRSISIVDRFVLLLPIPPFPPRMVDTIQPNAAIDAT